MLNRILKKSLVNSLLKEDIICKRPNIYYGGESGGKFNTTFSFFNRLKENKEIFKTKTSGSRELKIVFPNTTLLQTDFFDEFMKENNLWNIVSDFQGKDDKILNYFLASNFSDSQRDVLLEILSTYQEPIIVRSSALNEDMANASFAGVFYSFFLGNTGNVFSRLEQLETAIKTVFFSMFKKDALEYMKANKLILSDQKMAIIIQDAVGNFYNIKDKKLFYPEISFVAFSYNDYPILPDRNEGYYKLAFGLGEGVVEINPETSIIVDLGAPHTPVGIFKEKDLFKLPTKFYALNLEKKFNPYFSNLEVLNIVDYVPENIYSKYAWWYDQSTDEIKRSTFTYGDIIPIMRFYNLTENKEGSLTQVLKTLLFFAQENFGTYADIEGSLDLISLDNKDFFVFYLLQARPQIRSGLNTRLSQLPDISKEKIVLSSPNALGKGKYSSDVFVFFDLDVNLFYYSAKLEEELLNINQFLSSENKKYFLLVPGRLGTAEPSVGIKARFSSISSSICIIEKVISENVNSSRGSHFFEEIIGAEIAYLNFKNKEEFNGQLLEKYSLSIITNEFSKIYFLEKPLNLAIDKKGNSLLYFSD